jgi:two-component system, NtrC family, nitrogen regulation response regulator GlnG
MQTKFFYVYSQDLNLFSLIEEFSKRKGYTCINLKNRDQLLWESDDKIASLIIFDTSSSEVSSLDIIRDIKLLRHDVPVIVVADCFNTQMAIDAMKNGAYDYITKPLNQDSFLLTVEKSLGSYIDSDDIGKDPESISNSDRNGEIIIAESSELMEICKTIGIIANSDVTVLIQGESGTGKELIARIIHKNSKRSLNPFIAINCAAIPETLIESELFGHEKGSFTGATSRKLGRLEQCSGGTLFLDEIGDMSLSAQSKLLRFLQEKEFQRIGGNETISVDVRVISATNKSLIKCVENNSFRMDLYYRLKVFFMVLPPLRERGKDIQLLAEHFITKFSKKVGKNIKPVLDPDTLKLLSSYSWPGNVRELEHTIETAVVICKGNVLKLEYFPEFQSFKIPHLASSDLSTDSFNNESILLKWINSQFDKLELNQRQDIYNILISKVEKEIIDLALKKCMGNQVKASKILGISRNTLRDRIERFEQLMKID